MSFRSTVLDRKYVFEYDVGLWTFGTIQVLKDRTTGELKICKTVQKSLIRNPADAMARIQRLKELQHKHICAIYDVLEDHSRIYVISDKCAGGDVAEWIVRVQEEGNWLQEHTVAEYIRQTLIALNHIHGSRMSHRDLRPSSLALTSKLPDAQVKVADCGLAEIFDPQDEVILRSAGPFASPELLAGERGPHGGPASDMWSIGAIAHQLLVGVAPARQGDSGVFSLLALGANALSRDGDVDAWADRSALSQDFVRRMLRPEALERPTAATALQHQWMQACVPLEPKHWNANSQATAALKNRLLCYSLAVLLVPDVVQYRDLFQLRSAFSQVDADRDGFVPRATAERLLKERGGTVFGVPAAFDAVDVRGCGTVDLCAFTAAYVLATGFCPPETDEKGSTPAELVKRLLRGFFRSYGDPQRMVSSIAQINAKLTTPVVREVEIHAGVRFEELVAVLPDEGCFDAQALTAAILEGGGRGTPLSSTEAADDRDEFEGSWGEVLGLDGIQDLVKGVFQTCALGSEKSRSYRRIAAGLGGQ